MNLLTEIGNKQAPVCKGVIPVEVVDRQSVDIHTRILIFVHINPVSRIRVRVDEYRRKELGVRCIKK